MLAEHNSWFNSANIYCISSSLLLPHLVLIPDPSTILFVSLSDGSKTKTVETKPSSLLLQAELVSCLHPAAPALHAEHTWTDCIKNLNQRGIEWHLNSTSMPYRPYPIALSAVVAWSIDTFWWLSFPTPVTCWAVLRRRPQRPVITVQGVQGKLNANHNSNHRLEKGNGNDLLWQWEKDRQKGNGTENNWNAGALRERRETGCFLTSSHVSRCLMSWCAVCILQERCLAFTSTKSSQSTMRSLELKCWLLLCFGQLVNLLILVGIFVFTCIFMSFIWFKHFFWIL